MYPYRWGLNDGDSLDDLLLVGLGSWAVKITDDGGHAGLVTHGGSEVDLLLGVILWEAVEEKLSAQFHATRHQVLMSTHDLTRPRCWAARFLGR